MYFESATSREENSGVDGQRLQADDRIDGRFRFEVTHLSAVGSSTSGRERRTRSRTTTIGALLALVAATLAWAPSRAWAQDNVHYIPPAFVCNPTSNTVGNMTGQTPYQGQSLTLSTNNGSSGSPVVVSIVRGDGTAIAGSPFSIFPGSPAIVPLGTATIPGNTITAIPENMVFPVDLISAAHSAPQGPNTVLTERGLICTASQSFFVQVRHLASSQGLSLSTKGQLALGTDFRTGHIVSNQAPTPTDNIEKSHFISFMATQNNTIVNVSEMKPGIVLGGPNAPATGLVGGVTTTLPFTVTLQAGQSYCIYLGTSSTAIPRAGASNAENDDLNGTRVSSNNPISVCSGSWLNGDTANGGRDIGYDQILPIANLPTVSQWVVFEGLAVTKTADQARLELPCVVSVVDGTHVFVNGNSTAIATLNAGQYFFVPQSNYDSNGLMYISADQKAYLYQNANGAFTSNGGSLCSIPSLPCASSSRVEIPQAQYWSESGNNTTIGIATTAGATLTVTSNGTAVTPTGPFTIAGTSTFVAYKYTFAWTAADNLVAVSSTGQFVCSLNAGATARGVNGVYTGFAQAPLIIWPQQALGVPVTYPTTLSLDQVNGYTSFTWYLNGNLVQGPSSLATYSATGPGTYTVTASGTSCPGASVASAAVVLPGPLNIQIQTGPVTPVAGSNNTKFNIPYYVTVTNRTGVTANNVQVTDNLQTGLGPLPIANWAILNEPTGGGAFTAGNGNASYNGLTSGNTNLLAAGVSLADQTVGTIDFTVQITVSPLTAPGITLPTVNDSATVIDGAGDTMTGTTPAPSLFPLEVTTSVGTPTKVPATNNTWNVPYTITAQNNSALPITGIQLALDLQKAFAPLATSSWSINSGPTASGSFEPSQINASYTGLTAGVTSLLNSGVSLAPGAVGDINLTIQLVLSSGANGYPTAGFSVTVTADEGISELSDDNDGANHMTIDENGDGDPTNDPTPFPDVAPTFTSAATDTFTVGTSGTFTVTTAGLPSPALSETGSLPSGVTFTDNGNGTATLAGTPAVGTGGTYSLTLTANNGVSPNGTQTFTLTVDEAPKITSAAATTFTVGTAGTFTVTTAHAFPANPALSETGSLPSGVTLTDNHNGTATLAGTPAVGSGGTFSLSLTANNGVAPNGTQAFTLTVDEAPTITSAAATTFTVGTAGTFTVTTAHAFPANPALSETGSLPSGVTFTDNHNGTATLAGTPAVGTGGTFSLSLTANNGVSPNGTQTFTLTVDEAPKITSAAATTFTVGTAGTFTVTTAHAFPANPALSETGSLPSGVTLTDNHNGTATLAGTPAVGSGGTFSLSLTANNGVAPNGTQAFTLTVDEAPTITSAAATTFTVGTAGTFTVTTAHAFPANPALSETGSLPSGVTFTDNHNGTATLAGTPAVGTGGTFSLSLTANNGIAPNGTQAFTLTVDEAPKITSAAATTFTVGTAGTFTVTTAHAFPANPALSETGSLPSGVTLTDNHNGTATLAGTPVVGSGGTFSLSLTANNGVAPNGTQAFTLTVDEAPTITSAAATTFTVGTAGTFTVTTSHSFPNPALSETGSLPGGVTFTDNHNGTATLAGTPAVGTGGTFSLSLTANNGICAQRHTNFHAHRRRSAQDHERRGHDLHRGHGRHIHGDDGSRVPGESSAVGDGLAAGWRDVHRQPQRHGDARGNAGGRERRHFLAHYDGQQRGLSQRHAEPSRSPSTRRPRSPAPRPRPSPWARRARSR